MDLYGVKNWCPLLLSQAQTAIAYSFQTIVTNLICWIFRNKAEHMPISYISVEWKQRFSPLTSGSLKCQFGLSKDRGGCTHHGFTYQPVSFCENRQNRSGLILLVYQNQSVEFEIFKIMK
jgi:hypothetical protein